jgi:1-deoxy-D-xylulose-5-phosphate reductoisomerase
MRHNVSILGSTGSIGTSALDLIERLNTAAGEARFGVAALAAHRSTERLIQQVSRFRPALACIGTEEGARRVQEAVGHLGTRVVWGPAGLIEAATLPEADFVLAAIVGAAGLEPTYAAVCAGKKVGLANKEALVLAGDLMLSAARASGAVLLPVDSEHNALHQCLRGESVHEVRSLVLTASGGPFSREPGRDLSDVTSREALAHPTWVMGPKITIDSATLMNKGLEVIEAHWLFGVPPERIRVVVHPQSIVHSMVEFVDGSLVCQMGAADMRHPIQYALSWPERIPTPLAPLDPASIPALTFQPPDLQRFPCLGLGWEALRAGGTMPAVLNAANEVAVAAFLEDAVSFTGIPEIIRATMAAHRPHPASTLNAILDADAWARRVAAGFLRPASEGSLKRSGGIT